MASFANEIFVVKSAGFNGLKIESLSQKFVFPALDNQPFITFSLSYRNADVEDVQIFIKRNKDNSWQLLKEDFHLKEKNSFFSELIFLENDVQFLELKVKGNVDWNKLSVDFYFPNFTKDSEKERNVSIEKSGPVMNCSCPIPSHETRSDWDPAGTHPPASNPTYTSVSHLIVHHAAGPNSSTDWAAVVRSIWNYHVNNRGWADIGYNYLIDPNGIIYEGRGDNVLGAHFSGMNSGTMGICLLGNYQPSASEDVQPTIAMRNSLIELLSWKACDLDKNPVDSSVHSASSQNLLNISGHRDAGTGTVCPGDNVYDILPQLRTNCASYMTNCAFVLESDLMVSSLNVSPIGATILQNNLIELEVGNAGAEDVVDSVAVWLCVDGDTIETFYFDTLQVGQLKYFQKPNIVFTDTGNHLVCVYIDSANNENYVANNSYCKTIYIQDTVVLFTDLKVNTIDLIGGNSVEINEPKTFRFEVKNVGNMTSEAIDANVKLDGVLQQIFVVPALNSGQIYTKDFTKSIATLGMHSLCLDLNEEVNENDITNNVLCKNFEVKNAVHIEEIDENFNYLNIYPNPVKNKLFVDFDLTKQYFVRIELVDCLGKIVYTHSVKTMQLNHTIDTESLSKGIYFFRIVLDKENVFYTKLTLKGRL